MSVKSTLKWKEFFKLPQVGKGAFRVWQRNMLHYRKTWLVSLLWTCLEPLMYLGAIGYGLGSYVSNMGGQSYVEFFFPGILASTAMMVSFIEGTYGNYTKLTFQKTYATILLAPVSAEDIVIGEILWTSSKGLFGACGVALIATLFGLVDSLMIVPALLVLLIVSWLFSSLAMIVTSWVRNYDSFVYFTSGFIIPMSLLAGIYFPVGQLPAGLQQLTWLLPLTHGVAAVRGVLLQGFTWEFLLHVVLLLIGSWVATKIAIHRIRRRLIQ